MKNSGALVCTTQRQQQTEKRFLQSLHAQTRSLQGRSSLSGGTQISCEEVYLSILTHQPKGQAYSLPAVKFSGIRVWRHYLCALPPPAPASGCPLHALPLSFHSSSMSQKGAYTLVWHSEFCGYHQRRLPIAWLWWPAGLMCVSPTGV